MTGFEYLSTQKWHFQTESTQTASSVLQTVIE